MNDGITGANVTFNLTYVTYAWNQPSCNYQLWNNLQLQFVQPYLKHMLESNYHIWNNTINLQLQFVHPGQMLRLEIF